MSSWRERLKAHGQVPRDALDAYRGAGRGVYEYVLDLDSLRAQGTSDPGVQAALLAGWIAFALQVLGDEMLDADAALDPATAHFVPPATAQQVTEFYLPVRAWMGRAQAAKASPSYTIDAPLPVELPQWVEAEPCPPAHLFALRQAVSRLREHTEALVPGFNAANERAHDLVAQGLAEARSAADYAMGMWGSEGTPPPAQVHEAIESSLKQAAETYFYLGQLIAMPTLADAPRRLREETQAEAPGQTFLDTIGRAYPRIGQRSGGGAVAGVLAGAGGGLLAGLVGGSLIEGILGGLGDDGGWGGGGGGWDNDGGGGWDGGGGGWDD